MQGWHLSPTPQLWASGMLQQSPCVWVPGTALAELQFGPTKQYCLSELATEKKKIHVISTIKESNIKSCANENKYFDNAF